MSEDNNNNNGKKNHDQPIEKILDLLKKPSDVPDLKKTTIEDFISFDELNLTDYKILYAIFGKQWYWCYNSAVLTVVVTILLAFSFVLFSKAPNYLWLLLLIPAAGALFFLKQAYQKKINPIVKQWNKVSSIKIDTNYNVSNDKMLLLKIRNLLFGDYLNANGITLSKERTDMIIDSLKNESSGVNYSYQSLTISISMLTIILSAFVGSWFRISTNINDFVSIGVKCVIFLLLLTIMFFYIEESFLKDIVRNKKNKYKRLIRVLENHSLNLDEV